MTLKVKTCQFDATVIQSNVPEKWREKWMRSRLDIITLFAISERHLCKSSSMQIL